MSLMPSSGFVDLEELKKTPLSLAVDPSIGGLLILGPKGTGKSSLVRAFAKLLPLNQQVEDYRCEHDARDSVWTSRHDHGNSTADANSRSHKGYLCGFSAQQAGNCNQNQAKSEPIVDLHGLDTQGLSAI